MGMSSGSSASIDTTASDMAYVQQMQYYEATLAQQELERANLLREEAVAAGEALTQYSYSRRTGPNGEEGLGPYTQTGFNTIPGSGSNMVSAASEAAAAAAGASASSPSGNDIVAGASLNDLYNQQFWNERNNATGFVKNTNFGDLVSLLSNRYQQ